MDITIPSHQYFSVITAADQDWKHWDEKKLTDLFWRGSGSGTCATTNGTWRDTPRFRIIEKARHMADWDIKMTDAGPCASKLACDAEFDEYIITANNRVPFKRHFDYKYLLDIDGNAFSKRLLPMLRSNSLVFRESTFDVFFDDFINPVEHYVSVNQEDLPRKYIDMKRPGSGAEEIAFDAFRTSTRYLRLEDMRCYMARLLIEYSVLLGDQKV
jgi:hypothetical protein